MHKNALALIKSKQIQVPLISQDYMSQFLYLTLGLSLGLFIGYFIFKNKNSIKKDSVENVDIHNQDRIQEIEQQNNSLVNEITSINLRTKTVDLENSKTIELLQNKNKVLIDEENNNIVLTQILRIEEYWGKSNSYGLGGRIFFKRSEIESSIINLDE